MPATLSSCCPIRYPSKWRRRKAEKKLFDEPVEADLSGAEIESVNSSADLEKEQEKPASEVRSPYIVGQIYTINVKTALNVRKGAGKSFGLVGYSNLTQDGKNHSNGGSALKNGTRVLAQEVKVISPTEVWIKIPSGWVCAIDGEKKHIV